MMRTDEPARLQSRGNLRDRRSLQPEHLRDELMSKWNQIVVGLVARLQQPSAHARTGVMQAVARPGLLDLSQMF
jgi:hypothetical protein